MKLSMGHPSLEAILFMSQWVTLALRQICLYVMRLDSSCSYNLTVFLSFQYSSKGWKICYRTYRCKFYFKMYGKCSVFSHLFQPVKDDKKNHGEFKRKILLIARGSLSEVFGHTLLP